MDLCGSRDPFFAPYEAGRICAKTRISGVKCPRCSHSRNYLHRYLSKTIYAIEAYFPQSQGRLRGLTEGDGCTAVSPIWLGALIITQMPSSQLSVRLEVMGAQGSYRAGSLPGIVESLSLRYVGGRGVSSIREIWI